MIVVKKQFTLGIANKSNFISRNLLYEHEEICSNFEYYDESWSSIKYIGQIMWNDLFSFVPFFIKKSISGSEIAFSKSKVSFGQNEFICKSGGRKNDWIFLKNSLSIEVPYSVEFKAKVLHENSEFQFAFFYKSIGSRYRFNLKRNKKLSFEVVDKGCFNNDLFVAPLSLPINQWVNFKIIISNDQYVYIVENQVVLRVNSNTIYKVNKDLSFAFILWDSDKSNIETHFKDLKIYKN